MGDMCRRLHVDANSADHVYSTEATIVSVSQLGCALASMRIPECQRCRDGEKGEVLQAVVYESISMSLLCVSGQCASHTHAKQASKDESNEQQGEANGELLVLGDGGCEGLARRGVPELLEGRGRH